MPACFLDEGFLAAVMGFNVVGEANLPSVYGRSGLAGLDLCRVNALGFLESLFDKNKLREAALFDVVANAAVGGSGHNEPQVT